MSNGGVTSSAGFDTYKKYLAIKFHFTPGTYDYFKYRGSVKAGRASYDSSPSAWMFEKFSKGFSDKDEILLYFAANAYYDTKKWWIGELIQEKARKNYEEFQTRKDARIYWFNKDLRYIMQQPNNNNSSPYENIVSKVRMNEISPDTLILFNRVSKGKVFDKISQIKKDDTLIWPTMKFKLEKLEPFLDITEKHIEDARILIKEATL
jgi:hypothetical protein